MFSCDACNVKKGNNPKAKCNTMIGHSKHSRTNFDSDLCQWCEISLTQVWLLFLGEMASNSRALYSRIPHLKFITLAL